MKHLILIDDDEIVQRAIERVLKRHVTEFATHSVKAAEEALALAVTLQQKEGESLQVVLVTDGDMRPKISMNGDEMVTAMRAQLGSALKGAVLLSGRGDEWPEKAESVGYVYGAKPIESAALVALVRSFFLSADVPST